MPTIAGLSFPDLPTEATNCENWDFIDDNIGWSLDTSTAYNTAWERCYELIAEINFQINEGSMTLNQGADHLNNYKTYLINGWQQLDLWHNAYGDWANATGWFGWQNDASCNHWQGANEDAQLHVGIIKTAFYTTIETVDYAISVLVAQEGADITSAETDAVIAELENTIATFETSTEKKNQALNILKFGNYVEYIAIGGAILILAYVGYKKLK